MKNRKILAIDDSVTVRQLVSLLLKDYQVFTAEDGEAGLSMYQQCLPDLVITDYNMPRMNGEAFLTELRKLDKSIPVVFLTTEYEDWLKKKILELGANGWITKPVKTQSFRDTIEAMLD